MMNSVSSAIKESSNKIDPNQISALFINAIPEMDEAKQQLAQILYQLLANGKPVSFEKIATALARSIEDVSEALKNWPGVFLNNENNVVGFWGIAVEPMGHSIKIKGITSYAWCAWDTLFIPEMVGATSQVTSTCEQTGEKIQLTVSADGVVSKNFNDIVLSFVLPTIEELQENATASFCHFVYFFKDQHAGRTWLQDHEGAFLLTLNEAFAVGKKLNAARYNLVLK